MSEEDNLEFCMLMRTMGDSSIAESKFNEDVFKTIGHIGIRLFNLETARLEMQRKVEELEKWIATIEKRGDQ